MLNFNATERKIHDYMERRSGLNVDLGDIARLIYQGRKRPPHWRGSCAAIMRTFILKNMAKGGEAVTRTSRLGRGGAAVYRMEGGS